MRNEVIIKDPAKP